VLEFEVGGVEKAIYAAGARVELVWFRRPLFPLIDDTVA